MNTFFYQNIEDIFTQSRLSVYKKDGVNDVTCLARYLFNIEICKSLYPALHIFEIALRNSIDKTLSGYAKTQNWYDVLTIDNESKNKIEEAKRKIKKHGKERADYGIYLIKNLAKKLEKEYGSGFGIRQLERARQFFKIYPIASTVQTQLNWSQYKLLISISDSDKREY